MKLLPVQLDPSWFSSCSFWILPVYLKPSQLVSSSNWIASKIPAVHLAFSSLHPTGSRQAIESNTLRTPRGTNPLSAAQIVAQIQAQAAAEVDMEGNENVAQQIPKLKLSVQNSATAGAAALHHACSPAVPFAIDAPCCVALSMHSLFTLPPAPSKPILNSPQRVSPPQLRGPFTTRLAPKPERLSRSPRMAAVHARCCTSM